MPSVKYPMYYYDNYLFFLLNDIPKETDMYQVHFVKTLSACAIVIMSEIS